MFSPRFYLKGARYRRLAALACALGVTLLLTSVGLAADEREVRFQVDGLSCPFCVFGLKKKLSQVEGLQGVEVDYKKGLVRARWDETKPFDEEAITKAVRDAGFTPGEISSPV